MFNVYYIKIIAKKSKKRLASNKFKSLVAAKSRKRKTAARKKKVSDITNTNRYIFLVDIYMNPIYNY